MKNFILFLSISLLIACGASDNSNPKNSKSSTEILDLKGSWQAPCSIDKNDNDSSKVIETYTDAGMNISATFYIDSDCSVEDASIKLTASISYAGERILSSGQTVKKIDALIDIESVLMLIHDERAKSIAIEENLCARTDWDSGEYINIFDCDTFSNYINSLKEQRKDIYHIDGNQAYWGSNEKPDDENGYPTELNAIANTRI